MIDPKDNLVSIKIPETLYSKLKIEQERRRKGTKKPNQGDLLNEYWDIADKALSGDVKTDTLAPALPPQGSPTGQESTGGTISAVGAVTGEEREALGACLRILRGGNPVVSAALKSNLEAFSLIATLPSVGGSVESGDDAAAPASDISKGVQKAVGRAHGAAERAKGIARGDAGGAKGGKRSDEKAG